MRESPKHKYFYIEKAPDLRQFISNRAAIFSIIQTALENGLDPYRYLTWLMKTASKTDLSADENLLPLLPWNAPPDCRVG